MNGRLVLKRKEGMLTDFQHKSGDKMRIRVYGIGNGEVTISIEDPNKNFKVERPERVDKRKARV